MAPTFTPEMAEALELLAWWVWTGKIALGVLVLFAAGLALRVGVIRWKKSR